MRPKQHKYNAKKTIIDGITFDSRKEARRYQELKLLERGKVIENLELQPEFEILKTHKDIEGKIVRGAKYIADFAYWQDGKYVIEDVKSEATKTQVYRLKKKLVEHIHQIKIREV